MARSLNPFLIRLSRWPRRIAALVCLVLAAASTLAPTSGSAAQPSPRPQNPLTAALARGQVAVPLTLASTRAAGFVRAGDHVGVLTAPTDPNARGTPALVADGLRVLATSGGDALSSEGPVVVLAADRPTALRLARVAADPLLVVMDRSP